LIVHSTLLSELDYDALNRRVMARFRSAGTRWSFDDVSAEEMNKVLRPGKEYEFSVGKAFVDLIQRRKKGVKIDSTALPRKTKERRFIA
jgi:hypothetical protein